MSEKKQILLYGIAANPPHGLCGHAGYADYFKDKFDAVWIIPVYRHMFSKDSGLVSYEHRMKMCQLNFEKLGHNVEVKATEKDMFMERLGEGADPKTLRLGTIDLVEYLIKNHENVDFSFAMGGDTFNDLCAGKWKRGDELMDMISFVIVHREGITIDYPEKCKIHTIPGLTDISSTTIRNSENLEELKTYLDDEVLEYIVSNHLYCFSKK
eukprot:TRINITY_DN773115_c0_g1_i1.p1 TRINITY_DN773115_c0_g1~~TRINITY_DN773115_c0_g1_i1.p1  ORF type:complete len:211 (-),score=40.70 TRINITY_DN773115_c0_g1_i1:110-742(-)